MHLLLRNKTDSEVISRPDETEDSSTRQERSFLLCSSCLNRVTRHKDRISVHGSHKHVFVNPHGLVFELGCFVWAVNCAGAGPAASEFTWFPGYTWQIAVCLSCLMHLGWKYDAPGREGFYGFILDRLIEDNDA